jgi:hypothetical protein
MTSTLIQTPFGEGSTVAEVIEGVDLSAKFADRALIAAFTSATSAWSGSPHQRLFRPLSLGRPDPLIQVARGEAEFQALDRPSERHDTPPGRGRSTPADRQHE